MEPDRYRLVARACPWANRAVIVRRLLGLEPVISMGMRADPRRAPWTFDLDPGGRDPVLGYERLQEAFLARFPDYDRDHGAGDGRRPDAPGRDQRLRAADPRPLHRVDGFTTAGAPDLYPEKLRDEMDDVVQRVYTEVNNGVYRCGFQRPQRAYDASFDRLFTALDWLEDRLADQRFLMGETITEADVRLFTTLARFDAVYHGHFKCNRQKLTEFPAVGLRARPVPDARLRRHDRLPADQGALLRRPQGHQSNAGDPRGPDTSNWLTPHGRSSRWGSPFGDGTPPGPVAAGEEVPADHGPGGIPHR